MDNKKVLEQHLTIEETAKALSISKKSVWNFVYSKRIGSVLIGRSRRIPVSAVEELLDRGRVSAA